MSSQNAPALIPRTILNVSAATHSLENVVAQCHALKPHSTETCSETATVRPQSVGVTSLSKLERHKFPTYIDRLPNELLCLIFQFVYVSGWITHTALKMGNVCKRWWYIVTGTGTFWTDVHAGQVDLARLSVRRSQQASLNFFLAESFIPRYNHHPLHVHRSGNFPETAVNLLIASIGRICKLVVTSRSETYSALVPRLAPFTAPRLKILHLDISEEGFTDHTAQAPFHDANSLTSRHLLNAPALEQLFVRTRRLRGELTIYPNINCLSLQLGVDDLHNSSFILGTMRAHEQLTELSLALLAPLYMQEHDINVRLLRLKSLLLKVGELEDAAYLLHRMEIPEVSQVELDLETRNQTAPKTTAHRLENVVVPLPLTFRKIPMSVTFERSDFGLLIFMKENSWSQPALAIRLCWDESIDETFICNSAKLFVNVFPRLDMISCVLDNV